MRGIVSTDLASARSARRSRTALREGAHPSVPQGQGTKVIEPAKGWAPLELEALWRSRELLYFLTWRDVKVRYKQTILGAGWAVLRPVLTMLIFTVVFGHFAKIPSEGVPYAIFSYCALVPWTFFAYAVPQSANSLVGNAHLISKVYFPRLVIPIAATVSGLPDFALAFALLLGMMLVYGIMPTATVLVLPFFVLLGLMAILAVGIWLSALSAQYRDVVHAVPFLVQIWLFATPVAYPISLIHGKLQLVFALNPMTGVVEGFRWALLGTHDLHVAPLVASTAVTMIMLLGGLCYFRRVERRLADVI